MIADTKLFCNFANNIARGQEYAQRDMKGIKHYIVYAAMISATMMNAGVIWHSLKTELWLIIGELLSAKN